jgi:aminoglycoside phosphotransferase (APT) family kinase protein
MSEQLTWAESGRFIKRYDSVASARESRRRTKLVGEAGVRTPAVVGVDGTEVVFELVEGIAGTALVSRHDVSHLLTPLLALHRTNLAGLQGYDSFRRITPRLVDDEDALPASLRERIGDLRRMTVMTGGTVHGDFHAGQLISDASGSIWLVDLDDLALGPPEVDLANFVAHLATHPLTRRCPLTASLAYWRRVVLTAWANLGATYDPGHIACFLEIATIRRALKLRERGDETVLSALAEDPSAA